jgi:hypothetical protein
MIPVAGQTELCRCLLPGKKIPADGPTLQRVQCCACGLAFTGLCCCRLAVKLKSLSPPLANNGLNLVNTTEGPRRVASTWQQWPGKAHTGCTRMVAPNILPNDGSGHDRRRARTVRVGASETKNGSAMRKMRKEPGPSDEVQWVPPHRLGFRDSLALNTSLS